jgi:uncharacterized damage-inducible protein DinB
MMESLTEWAAILAFNRQLLDQALDLVEACRQRPERDFALDCGAHLRHLVEHYEALLRALAPTGPALIAYDRRPRDRAVESCPQQMRERLLALQAALAGLVTADPQRRCAVELRGGLDGDQLWVSESTLARELLFLASHTTHHYALIGSRLAAQGLLLDARFGKAPATLRFENDHERAA